MPVTFSLGGLEVTTDVQPGQNLWEAAKEAGADITLGCSQGSCGVCEVSGLVSRPRDLHAATHHRSDWQCVPAASPLPEGSSASMHP